MKAEKDSIKTDLEAAAAPLDHNENEVEDEETVSRENKKGKQKKARKKRRNFLIFLGIFVFLLGIGLAFFGYDYYASQSKTIGNNIHFRTVDLSGLTKSEATVAIEEEFKSMLERNITLTYQERSWSYTAAELGLGQNAREVCESAYAVTRSGNIFNRYQDRFSLLVEIYQVKEELNIDGAIIDPVLEQIAGEIGVPAKDAAFALDENGDIYIVPSEDGVMLDAETTKTAVLESLGDSNVSEVALRVNVHSQPEQTTADLEAMQVNGVLASFSTKYNAGQTSRSQNLMQASKYLDMTIVGAGETFSFNDTVGERTPERGFSTAMVIESGVYTQGLGGGVCQVSTTLYGAILRTGLEVTQRRNHTLTCAYVPPSQDAMVAWGASDLCFKNNYDSAVVIHASCYGGTITMTIYGNSDYKQNVELISEVIRYIPFTTETVTDTSLPSGTEKVTSSGGRGLESNLYKKVYDENGAEISSEKVNHDVYAAQKRIIAVGP